LEDNYFEYVYISNIVFDGDVNIPGVDTSKKSPLKGIDTNSLQVLTLINIDFDKFNWEPLKAAKKLTAIHIENCSFKHLEKAKFGLISDLKIISLTIVDSKLETIEASAFEGWDSLKMLTIKNAYLKNFDWIKTKLPQLWYLDLTFNYIDSISTDFFSFLPQLKVLKLDENNIKLLDWKLIEKYLPKLHEFSLTSNLNDKNCALI